MRYAHDELRRQVAIASGPAKAWARWVTARSALVISRRLVHPDAYAAVGLTPSRHTAPPWPARPPRDAALGVVAACGSSASST